MTEFEDITGRKVMLTEERLSHIGQDHPEMSGQLEKVKRTLTSPEKIVRSRTDPSIELYYREYLQTPVTRKYMCVVVKEHPERYFIVTAYFTDTVKKGEILWPRK